MKKYEAGDTVAFQEKEYLVTQVISIEENDYLILSSLFQPFQLIFCIVKEDDLEMVIDKDIANQLLSKVGKQA